MVRLYTNKLFDANVRLYLGFGYRIDREETSALGVTVYMSKSLQWSPLSGRESPPPTSC